MDYAAMLQHHHPSGADLTVACLTVPLDEARSFGVMTVDEEDRIVSFHEKPENPRSIPGDPGHALASMGVYVFSMKLLAKLLNEDHERDSAHDFGKNIIPSMIGVHRLMAYRFGGTSGRVTADRYWEMSERSMLITKQIWICWNPCLRLICTRETGQSGHMKGNTRRRGASTDAPAARQKSSIACSPQAHWSLAER